MLKTKRLLNEEEFNKFLELRETKGDRAAAKYIGGLKEELFEIVEKDIKKDVSNKINK